MVIPAPNARLDSTFLVVFAFPAPIYPNVWNAQTATHALVVLMGFSLMKGNARIALSAVQNATMLQLALAANQLSIRMVITVNPVALLINVLNAVMLTHAPPA
jgi:hypothetical protein